MSKRRSLVLALLASVLVTEQGQADTPNSSAYLFFDRGSDRLSSDAEAILINFIAADKLNGRPWPLFIEGGTDYSRPERLDPGLSCRRTSDVRRYLIARGVPNKDLIVRSYAAAQPLVNAAPPESREARLRRVLVRYGGDTRSRLFEWQGRTPRAC